MTEAAFYQNMTAFLSQLDDEAGAPDIGPDDNLFDEGLVTSMSVVRIVAHFETLVGHRVDVARHGLERFFTLREMYQLANALGAPGART
ncbi:hypothetical protein Lfu02_03730 [Longispora fulva]|uniref:Acyl carrier protein n=1 Tax=Longispora fulva TaxID=619741 RepID=A0A8J7GGM5_9ACTN|nr:acyl carrier protein [Longispora fulva]MBG6135758.1 acyl carrier protein [Longispora fulva]GIG56001.1 hypothetical protein Lfu02_03730 [Longispora fulva]